MTVPLSVPSASVLRTYLEDLKASTQTVVDQAMTVGVTLPEVAEALISAETNEGSGVGAEWTSVIKPEGRIKGEMLTKLDGEQLRLVLPQVQQAICRRIRFQLMSLKDGEFGELSRSLAQSFKAYRAIGRFLAAAPGTVDETLFVEYILPALE